MLVLNKFPVIHRTCTGEGKTQARIGTCVWASWFQHSSLISLEYKYFKITWRQKSMSYRVVSAAGVCVWGSRIKPVKQTRVIPDAQVCNWFLVQTPGLKPALGLTRVHASNDTFPPFLFERERNTRHLSAQGGIIDPNAPVLWGHTHIYTRTPQSIGTFNVWRKLRTLTCLLFISDRRSTV